MIDGKLYVVAGYGGTSIGGLDVYDPATNTWTPNSAGGSTTQGIGGALVSPAVAVLAKKLYVLGGFLVDASGETGDILFEMSAYDPATGTSSEMAHMNVGREEFVARTVTYGGVSSILAVGVPRIAQVETWSNTNHSRTMLIPWRHRRGRVAAATHRSQRGDE